MSPKSPASGQRRRRATGQLAGRPPNTRPPVRLVSRDGTEDVSTLPSSERVYRSLRDQILTGALAPLTRLVELHVAHQFAVSRTPVREALKRLIAEGMVVDDPQRGMVVRDVDPAEVEDIYIIREVLDGLAARLAANRASPTDLIKLHLLMELMQESASAQRWEAVVQINIKFHEVLYAAAGNDRLALIGRSLQDAVRRYSPRALSQPERVAAVLREHGEIVAALEEHDLEQAEASARRHLAAARHNFSALFAPETSP